MIAPPFVTLRRVVKQYGGVDPLRIQELDLGPGFRLTIAGLDIAAAEMCVHLVTGAALPDEGEILVDGRRTSEIATDTDWLASLDRFGLVSARAVLLDGMPIAANLALPLTLDVDPLDAPMRATVTALAEECGLERARLDAPASSLTPEERVRVHLARAIATSPSVLLLEHPAARLTPAQAEAIGATLARVGETRSMGWLALDNDDGFARACGSRRLRLEPATGALNETKGGSWTRFLFRR
jgi:ABC-type transporter Mla maintaining outer membrane lipid asymmetry ATPase subunit MlaF